MLDVTVFSEYKLLFVEHTAVSDMPISSPPQTET